MKEFEAEKFPMIEAMAHAIQKHEGWFEGSRSFRNNNPGNFVCTTYVKKYLGAIGCEKDGRFAVFRHYPEGFFAIQLFIYHAATDQLKNYSSNMSLLQFFQKYAPSSDGNNPKNYAAQVAAALGVKPNFKISGLLATNAEIPQKEPETKPQDDAGEPKTDPEAIDYSKRPQGTSRREWFAMLTGLPRALYSKFAKKDETQKIEVKSADPEAQGEFEIYVVKSGDSLAKIARENCGRESLWTEIFEANKETIKDARVLKVGTEIKIPKNLLQK